MPSVIASSSAGNDVARAIRVHIVGAEYLVIPQKCFGGNAANGSAVEGNRDSGGHRSDSRAVAVQVARRKIVGPVLRREGSLELVTSASTMSLT